jgi:hypothetical protein
MKSEDLGFNPEHTQHDPVLTDAEDTLLTLLLRDHVGAERKIGATELALYFHEEMLGERVSHKDFDLNKEAWKREVRYLVNHLVIDHDQPILSKAGNDGGYWIAENEAEVEEFYETFRRRAMTGLTKAARGRKAVLAETINQLALEFDDLQAERLAYVRPRLDPGSTPLTLVVSLIDKMTREPQRFGRDIEILRQKLGKVLLPKETFQEIQATSAKLQELVGRIG